MRRFDVLLKYLSASLIFICLLIGLLLLLRSTVQSKSATASNGANDDVVVDLNFNVSQLSVLYDSVLFTKRKQLKGLIFLKTHKTAGTTVSLAPLIIAKKVHT